MKFIINNWYILFTVLLSCGKVSDSNLHLDNSKDALKSIDKIEFIPDSTINNEIKLQNPLATLNTLGEIMSYLDYNKDYPEVSYKSKNQNAEYLRVLYFPGNESNSISQFEIGIADTSVNGKLFLSNYSFFKTESGIKLGMTKREVIAIKGDAYQVHKLDGQEMIRFKIDDFDKSQFLKRYNMPVYFAEYYFSDRGRLIRFKFGFEYP